MSVTVSGSEIVLIGTVGDMYGGWGFEDCFTASGVIAALAQIGHNNDVVIRINSGGGIATEGSAIHAALARHAGKKTVVIEGIAASAASIIAMAGDDVSFALGAIMMIHLPAGYTVGTVADHEMQIQALTALGSAMASIYAAKSGRSSAECLADMTAETWMTAEEAIAKGYADRVETANDNEAGGAAMTTIEPAPFDYTLYAHAPRQMVAMAKANHWNARPAMRATTPAPAPAKSADEATGDSMTEEELNAKLAEAKAAGIAEAEAKAKTEREAAARTALSPALAADIAKACNEGGVPTMIASLLSEAGITLEKATARIKSAGDIKEHVALAHRQNPAAVPLGMTEEFIAAGKTPVQVKEALFDKLAAATDDVPLASHHRAGAGGADHAAGTEARAKSKANMKAALEKRGLAPKKEG